MTARHRMVGCMQRKRNVAQSSLSATVKPLSLELPPDRAFVLHLDVRAQPPRRVLGRIEHVTSGQKTHVTSMREVAAFLAKVLRDRNPSDENSDILGAKERSMR